MADERFSIRRLSLISELPQLHVAAIAVSPPSPPCSELHALILSKQWEAAIERCRTHPNEVSSELRDDRGYTVLHSLLAYNRTTAGGDLVPLVTAILRAAEEIDFAAEFPVGRVEYDDVYHMKQFYQDVEAIKSDIAVISSATEQITTALRDDEALFIATSTTEKSQKSSGEAIRTLISNTNDRATNCQKKLELLQKENSHIVEEQSKVKEKKPNTDDLRVRENLVTTLQNKFSHEMERYDQLSKEVINKINAQNEALDNAELNGDATTPTSRKTGGSLRLLLDQNNRAKWSPLHLICVQGGFTHGKVPLFRALLQERQDDSSHQLLSLLDRQNRNVLHHLLEIQVPSDDTFQAVHYVIGRDYSLLLQHDDQRKTPLRYVFDRHYEHIHFTRTGVSNGHDVEDRNERNYRLLKVLIGYLVRGEKTAVTNEDDVSNDDIIPQNFFHAVCSLPMGVCPENMFKFLYKDVTSLKNEVDESGNTTLHVLLANASYAGETQTSQLQSYVPHNRASNQSRRDFRYVLASNRDAIYAVNNSGHLPLRIAMDAGHKGAILSDLIMVNHRAVLLDKRLDGSPKLMAHVLGVVASSSDTLEPDSEPKIVDNVVHPLDTIFELIRAKPDIVSFGGSGVEILDVKGEKEIYKVGKKTWRKKLNPFRLCNRESKH